MLYIPTAERTNASQERAYTVVGLSLSLSLSLDDENVRESLARDRQLYWRVYTAAAWCARVLYRLPSLLLFFYIVCRVAPRASLMNANARAPPFLRGSYIFLYESITRKVRAVQCAQVIRRILLVNARGEIEDRSWRWVWGRAPPPSLGGTCTGRCNRPRAEFFSLFSREVTSFERRVVVGGGVVVQGKLAVAFWKGDEVWWREREREIVNLIVWKFYFISWEASIFRLLILILSKNV